MLICLLQASTDTTAMGKSGDAKVVRMLNENKENQSRSILLVFVFLFVCLFLCMCFLFVFVSPTTCIYV